MTEAHQHDAAHGHDEIHLPPNSWVPINFSLSLMVSFVGLLGDVRNRLHDIAAPLEWSMTAIGVLWLVVTLAVWLKAARTEYQELP
jgi:hypothetical protein